MRIAVDGRHLAAGRGVARYSRTLLGALRELFGGEEWAVVERQTRWRYAAAAAAGRPRLERLAQGADVVWAPAPAPLAVGRGVPFVLTVHDLSWVQRPGDFTRYERAWHRASRVRALVQRADRVIAVSAATRDALLTVWDVPAERVRVVRSGPGIGAPAADAARGPAAPPYLLAVGALEPRKQPELLARAWRRAREEGLRADLWFAGEGRLAGAVESVGARVLGPVGDEALRPLYAGALALVAPAALEGFAFPPVEAALHGAPAVVADLPVHAETIGDGALRVPPGDERALADALLRIERDPDLRERLAAAGRAAAARLSWERAARETHAVLAEAAAR